MLDEVGMVFHHNMGHTLSHFDVQLAGPMGRLLCHGYPCYEFSVFRGRRDEQDLATIRHFQDFATAACDAAHTKFSDASRAALQTLGDHPALLMFDYCHPKVGADQRCWLSGCSRRLWQSCPPGLWISSSLISTALLRTLRLSYSARRDFELVVTARRFGCATASSSHVRLRHLRASSRSECAR